MDITLTFQIIALVVAGLLAICGLHHLLLWMEKRGWIYYINSKEGGGATPSAFLEIQSMFEPNKKYTLEVKQEEKSEESESGDPPEPGKKTKNHILLTYIPLNRD